MSAWAQLFVQTPRDPKSGNYLLENRGELSTGYFASGLISQFIYTGTIALIPQGIAVNSCERVIVLAKPSVSGARVKPENQNIVSERRKHEALLFPSAFDAPQSSGKAMPGPKQLPARTKTSLARHFLCGGKLRLLVRN